MDKNKFIQTIIPLRNNLLVLARRYVGNQEEAEDVVQETFAKLWVIRDRLSKYDSPAALSVTVAKNICLNRIRKENRRMSALEQMGSEAIQDDDGEEREEEVKQVHAIIGRLPDLQQMVLRMKYIDEMEVEEIAQVLNCSRDAVWMNLSRARKKIKELYDTNAKSQ